MKPTGILRKKTKKEKPFWALLLKALLKNGVKAIVFVLVVLLFTWAFLNTFSALDPMQACALSYGVLAALIIWK